MRKQEPQVVAGILTILAISFALFLISQLGTGITGLTFIEGSAATVNASSTGLRQFAVLIDGALANSSANYTGNLTVRFVDNLTPVNSSGATYLNLTDFVFDFSTNVLNLTPIVIERQSNALAIRNLSLFGATRNVYVFRKSSYVCVKDAANASISSISENCTGTDERVIRCDGTNQQGTTCYYHWLNNMIRIANVSSAAVKSLPFILLPSFIGQGANITLNITGQDFLQLTNISFNTSDMTVTNFTIVNNTHMTATVRVLFNATPGRIDAIVSNATGIYRVQQNVLRLIPATNFSDAVPLPVVVNVSLNTLINLTLFLGNGVNNNSLNFTLTNITLSATNVTYNSSNVSFNNTDLTIVINQTNITYKPDAIVAQFWVTLPAVGAYTVLLNANLSQDAPSCTTNCVQSFDSAITRKLTAAPDTSFSCTGVTLTQASTTSNLGTESDCLVISPSTGATYTGTLDGPSSTCDNNVQIGITVGGTALSATANNIYFAPCSPGSHLTGVTYDTSTSGLTGTVQLTSTTSGGNYQLDLSVCTVATTTQACTSAPGAFTQTTPSNGAADQSTGPTFTWADSSGETSYILQVALDIAFSNTIVRKTGIAADSTSTSLSSGTLSEGTRYFWRVIASNSGGDTTASNAPFAFTTGRSAGTMNLVSPPTGASIVSNADQAFVGSISPAATSYTFEIATDSAFSSVVHTASSSNPVFNLPASTLSAGSYFWRINPTNSFGGTETAITTNTFTSSAASSGGGTIIVTVPPTGGTGVTGGGYEGAWRVGHLSTCTKPQCWYADFASSIAQSLGLPVEPGQDMFRVWADDGQTWTDITSGWGTGSVQARSAYQELTRQGIEIELVELRLTSVEVPSFFEPSSQPFTYTTTWGERPTCFIEVNCLPCHGGGEAVSAGAGGQGVCLHYAHQGPMSHGQCPNEHAELPCGSTPTAGGRWSTQDIAKAVDKMKECCVSEQEIIEPIPEIPGIPPPMFCPPPVTETDKKCIQPPARIQITETKYVFDPPPQCPKVQVSQMIRWEKCPTPPARPNACYDDGKSYCKGNACAMDPPQCKPTSDAACCNVGPTGLAPNACAFTHIGGGTLFTYDGYCRNCKLDCGFCDFTGLLSTFPSILTDVPGQPGNLIDCFNEAQEKAMGYALGYWSPIYPPYDPFQPPPPTPTPPPEIPGVPPVPEPGSRPSTGPTDEPGETVTVDTVGPITQITTTQPPAPQPRVTVPVVEQPAVICAATGGGAPGAASIGPGGSLEGVRLPPGDEVITTFSASCTGGARGQPLEASVNIPNNFVGVRVFHQSAAGLAPVQGGVVTEATCGGSATSSIRSQQIGESRGEYYALQEMPAIVRQEAVVLPGEQLRLETGRYAVELLGTIGTARASLSMPESDVPYPANPSARIIGTPLRVTFDQMIAGRTRITFPATLPLFIEPSSIGIFALIGTTWRQLEGVEIEEGQASVVVDDLSLFLEQQPDGTYEALFALIGIYCASCPGTKLEKVYDGGSRQAVLLIHGITTDSLRWQFLVDDFALTKQPFQVWTFSYPLGMVPDQAGKELASQLEQEAAAFDKLHMVTHSMGGIEAQLALDYARKNGFSFARKVDNVIFAGQPGLGSPAAEVYGRLFGFLLNLKSTAMLFGEDSPMLKEAVIGRQVPRTPGVEYFIIAGRQPYKFTADLFAKNGVFDPNDGVVTTRSARTIGNQEITDQCEHYFEVQLTHTDLIDAWLPRRIMGRIVGKDLAEQEPENAIIGYNKIVQVSGECKPGTYIVTGRRIPEEQTEDPALCKCGNDACDDGESEDNCPGDCSQYYQLFYPCRIAPWLWFPLLVILLAISSIYTARAIKKHERGKGAGVLFFLSLVMLAVLLTQHFVCGVPPLLGYVLLAFTTAMLSFTLVHLQLHSKRIPVDNRSGKALEWLLEGERKK